MRAATRAAAAARAARFHTMARPAEHEYLFTGTFRLDRTRLAPGVPRTVPVAEAAAALAAAAVTRALVVHGGNPIVRRAAAGASSAAGGGATSGGEAASLLAAPLGATLAALGATLPDALTAAASSAAICIVLGVHEADGATWAIVDASGGGSEAEVAAKLAPLAGGDATAFVNARDLFFGAMARGATVAAGVRAHSGDGAGGGGDAAATTASATGEAACAPCAAAAAASSPSLRTCVCRGGTHRVSGSGGGRQQGGPAHG